MASGTHVVIVWVRENPGGEKLFTLTARAADPTVANLLRVEQQVEEAQFVEDLREAGLTEARAKARKAELKAEYRRRGYKYQPRKAHQHKMMDDWRHMASGPGITSPARVTRFG